MKTPTRSALSPLETFQRSAISLLRAMVTEPLWLLEDALPSVLSMFDHDKLDSFQARLASRPEPKAGEPKAQWEIEEDWCGNPVPKVEISADGVAVVPFRGMVVKGAGNLGRYLGMCDLDLFRENMLAVESNGDVRMIVLDASSAGGYSIGCVEASSLVVRVGKKKPLMTYTDTILGSAGYWVCGGAPVVYCSRSCIIGGIGTYMVIDDISGWLEELGVKRYVIRSGWAKGIGEDKITAKQLEYLTEKINKIAEQFKTFISSQRTLIDKAHMEGQAYFGDEGVANGFAAGLADSLPEAVAKFSKQINQT